MTRTSY